MKPLDGSWRSAGELKPLSFTCGHCGERTGVRIGYKQDNGKGMVYLCGGCNRPNYFEGPDGQVPEPTLGNEVKHLPSSVEPLYEEARHCTQVEAYTSCVLSCRKILMHVAVEKGADENKSFLYYVEYLSDNNYLPPDGKTWVDHIRTKGNEANHEIVMMSKDDAFELLSFAEMLLKFVYEFPARLTPSPSTP
jgi:hypothetical protein